MTDVVPAVPTAPLGSPTPGTDPAPTPRPPPQMPTVSQRVRAPRPHDARREARAARRLLARPERHRRPDAVGDDGRPGRRRPARGDHAARDRALHARVRHAPRRPGGARGVAVGGAAAAADRDAAGDPGDRARGVPHGPRRVAGRDVPDAARVGRVVRPGPRRGDGARGRESMRTLGVHQGLAPVLDVVRDPRWGASTSASARTRTSSARSARRTCAVSRTRACTRRSSTSSGTRAPARGATTRP